MDEAKVSRVIEDVAKHGVSAKTGKDWSMAKVELSNGQTAYIFNPVAEGDTVVAQQNGEYTNWIKKKADPKHDEVMTALRRLYALQQDIYRAVSGQRVSSPTPAPKVNPGLATQPADDFSDMPEDFLT